MSIPIIGKETEYTINGIFNSIWLQVCEAVYRHGQTSTVRGMKTLELMAHKAVMPMDQAVLTLKGRNLGYQFMAAESHWILTGSNKLDALSPYSKIIGNFSDDQSTLYGAYGPKFIEQLDHVIGALQKEQFSRQAVINAWIENPNRKSKDIPCTLSWQFVMRGNALHVFQTMRSNDVWLGFPYDMFSVSMIGAYVALSLRATYPHIQLGHISSVAGSRHLYEPDIKKFINLLNKGNLEELAFDSINLDDYGSPGDLLYHLIQLRDQNFDMMYPVDEEGNKDKTGYPGRYLRELRDL